MIYLDNAATSFPKPDLVSQAIANSASLFLGSYGRTQYGGAYLKDDFVALTRALLCGFFGVSEPYRVIFTYSTTDALNLVLKGFLSRGDRVLISDMEHNSVLRPLAAMQERGEIELEEVPSSEEDFDVDLVALEKLLVDGKNVKLVVINHASNVNGAVRDVKKVSELVRKYGAYLLVDAAQSAGAIDIKIERDGIDFLAAAGHKGLFGLQGTGVLALGSRVEQLRAFREGGTGFDSVSRTQPKALPEFFEAGTMNMLGILTLQKGIEFINQVGVEEIHKKELHLLSLLKEGLRSFDNIKIYTNRDDKKQLGVLSFTIDGWEASDIGDILRTNHEIQVRTGLHCALLAHERLQTAPLGTVRVSVGYFNEEKDIDKFIKAIAKIAKISVPLY